MKKDNQEFLQGKSRGPKARICRPSLHPKFAVSKTLQQSSEATRINYGLNKLLLFT